MKKRLAAAVLVLICAVAPVVAQEQPRVEGTWYVKVLVGGAFQLSYLQQFTADGRTVLLLPFGPGTNAGDTRVGCMGEWKKRPGPGARQYDVAMRCLYDQNWDSPYGEIRGVFTLSRHGDRFTADFTYLDWADGIVVWSGDGVMNAERIVIHPPK